MKYLILLLTALNLLALPSLEEINSQFQIIAEKYEIPAELLRALAYKQSGWNVNFGKNDEINQGMFGIMGLYSDNRISSIQYGAKLLNTDPVYGIIDYKTNIEMAARILSELKNDYIEAGEDIYNLEDYYPILVDYLDYDDSIRVFAEGLARKIYILINSGFEISNEKERIRIERINIDLGSLYSSDIEKFYKKYTEISSLEDIEFIYTSHKYDGRGGNTIDQIVIHLMQGYFEGTISHFKNGSPATSAHYLISQQGEIVQMVKVSDRAWHAGNHNGRSIGIEHEGFDGASYHEDSYVTEDEYQASAMLVKWLAERYNIPLIHRDAYHDENGNFVPWHLQRPELSELPGILGHHDCNGKEFCPGPHWNWDYYMQLLTGGSNLNGEITPVTPKPNETVDNPVVFKCKVDGDIKKVKYFADDTYLLGESENKGNDFKVKYEFRGIGIRNVSFKGYDEHGNLVPSSVKTFNINIIEAGEGNLSFKTPLDNTESSNPVILETNATGDIKKVKYFAENTIFLGESTDKDNNFHIERAFSMPGRRILQAIGYNENDIAITDAFDEVTVTVPPIDDVVVEECINECEYEKEKKCNINGSVDICVKAENCLIWQSYTECGSDEFCDEGECHRRNTDRKCNDECIFVGQNECNGEDTVLVCKLDNNNCLKFYTEQTCPEKSICKVGKCIPAKSNKEEESNDGCSYSKGKITNLFIMIFMIILIFFYGRKALKIS